MVIDDSQQSRISVSRPNLDGNEEAYVVDALRSTWISSTGCYVDRFEQEFAERCESKACVSVCNGTCALHLAIMALGAGPGDEVILPSLTYVATANAVRYVGATPVFVDVDPDSWCIDPVQIESAVTERTVGIIPVHLFGHPADMVAIQKTATSNGLWVLEDAAEAHFATCEGKTVGSLGDLAIFSFYGNKIIASGEGGAVVDRDGKYAEQIRLLRGQGVDPNRRYFHSVVGYNYRLTNIACAILCAQLERADELIAKRRVVDVHYRDMLSESICTFQKTVRGSSIPWMVGVLFPTSSLKQKVANALGRINVETRPFFVPLHKLPFYVTDDGCQQSLPVTERLGDTGLCLPTHADLSRTSIEKISTCIIRACYG